MKEAVEVLEYAHGLDPKLANALNNLGNAYGRSGMPQRAIEAFQAALRLNPTSALTYANLGAQYYLLRRYHEAATTKVCSPALAQKLYAEIFKGKVLDISEKTRSEQK
jgi:tetratricopeptide (TPR) repeat protein